MHCCDHDAWKKVHPCLTLGSMSLDSLQRFELLGFLRQMDQTIGTCNFAPSFSGSLPHLGASQL